MSAAELGWQHDAACKDYDPALWETDRIMGPGGYRKMAEREATAKAICETCPVQNQCLNYGVGIGIELGLVDHIYGGLTPREQAAELGVVIRFSSGLTAFADETAAA